MTKKIIIIGAGWYGCYIALLLQNIYDVIIIEKNNDIFNESSFYNQNRLHLGFHYCRNFKTRELCKDGYYKFYDKFNNYNLIDKLKNNYYLISNKSLLDYKTINSIFSYENYNFEIKKNDYFNNIDENILLVDELVINSEKSKNYFKENLTCNFMFNKKVIKIMTQNNAVILNDNNILYGDIIFDCTNNYLNLSTKNYLYEKTISLLYKKINNTFFDAITLIDGNFFSIYPHDQKKQIYTVTDVEFTPLIKSSNLNDILNYKLTDDKLNITINKILEKIKYYYPDFEKYFEYNGFFLSNKTKLISNSDSRECNIENFNDKIITINCGKITGIFVVEKYLKEIGLI